MLRSTGSRPKIHNAGTAFYLGLLALNMRIDKRNVRYCSDGPVWITRMLPPSTKAKVDTVLQSIRTVSSNNCYGSHPGHLRIRWFESMLHRSLSGNVGIGTSSPDTLVQATNTSASTNYISYEIGSSGISSANKGGFAIYELGSLATSITYARDGTGHTDFNAETLVFNNAANTTEYMRIDSSGNVGIGLGAAAPLEKLHSAGRILSTTSYGSATQQVGTSIGQNAAVNATVDFRRWTGAGTNHGVGAIEVTDSGVMVFYTDSKTTNTVATSERMRIDASGNVGIGTSTPNSAGLGANGQTLQLGARTFIATDSSGDTRLGGLSGSNITAFYQGGTERMRIDVSGNVGIGTSSPSQKLDVKVATDAKLLVQEGNTAGNVKMQAVNNAVSLNTNLEIAALNTQFFNGGTERMRIDSSGNVGIGTSSPKGKINSDVGNTTTVGAFSSSGLNITSTSGATNNIYQIGFGYASGATNAPASIYALTTSNTGFNNNAICFATRDVTTDTAPTERMRLDASGNLQVGVAGTNNGRLDINAGSGTYIIDAINAAGARYFAVDKGAPVNSFIVDSGGNVGIGHDGSYKLDVLNTTGNVVSARITTTALAAQSYGAQIALTNDPNDTTRYFLEGDGGGNARFRIYSNGNMVNQNNSYTGISDEKLKENIVDAGSQWDDIKALRVRKYSFKEENASEPTQIGVIAQEVEAAGMSGLVYETADQDTAEDGSFVDTGEVTKTMKYSILYMKAVKALQEAMDRIETLEAKVAALES
jgi:hypothetical protein